MKNTRKNIRRITFSAVTAALYVALTLVCAALGLSSGVIQIRVSEALTVLPVFTSAAIPGLVIGCFISNLLTGGIPIDIVFGTAATLIGAIGTYTLRRKPGVTPLLPPIVANTLIVPFVLKYGYGAEGTVPFFMLTVGVGEIISCGVLGMITASALKRHAPSVFFE